jgi:GTP-binding protein
LTKGVVAIVGRQNVGKSTLLNRMAGKPVSIVADLPGTTRDRIFADVSWEGKDFTVIDTGGLMFAPESRIDLNVIAQVDMAVDEADLIIFLVDARDGLTVLDEDIAGKLRKIKKQVLLVVNKADNAKLRASVPEFYSLGLGDPIPISAYHREGVAEMLDKIIALLPERAADDDLSPEAMKIAIVGRPGVGKSLLLNSLLRTERAVVGDTPGTTRDATDTLFDFAGRNVLLIDTAGIRRRGRIGLGVESWSVIRSLRAIDRCDIALLVLDATELPTAQDTHIAGYIQQALKGILLLVNKWDLVASKNTVEYTTAIREGFKFVPYASLLFISAKLKQGLEKIMPEAWEIYQERQKRHPNDRVNEVVKTIFKERTPPSVSGKQLRIYSTVQSEVNPPGFTFTVNNPKLMHFSYRRYLENRLRENFGFAGTPIRLTFKTGR